MEKFMKLFTIMLISFAALTISCSSSDSDEKNRVDSDQIQGGIARDETVDVESEQETEVIDNSDDDGLIEPEEERDADLIVVDEDIVEAVTVEDITDYVVLNTSLGDIRIGLYGDLMPGTTKNFLNYVKDTFYDGLIFHRVIKGFVIQGGGFNENMEHKETRDAIKHENSEKIKHLKYVISMARANNPHTATSQFFITLDVVPHLDPYYDEQVGVDMPGYAAFGVVTEGFDIVDKIGEVKTVENDVPEVPVYIEKAFVAND